MPFSPIQILDSKEKKTTFYLKTMNSWHNFPFIVFPELSDKEFHCRLKVEIGIDCQR